MLYAENGHLSVWYVSFDVYQITILIIVIHWCNDISKLNSVRASLTKPTYNISVPKNSYFVVRCAAALLFGLPANRTGRLDRCCRCHSWPHDTNSRTHRAYCTIDWQLVLVSVLLLPSSCPSLSLLTNKISTKYKVSEVGHSKTIMKLINEKDDRKSKPTKSHSNTKSIESNLGAVPKIDIAEKDKKPS